MIENMHDLIEKLNNMIDGIYYLRTMRQHDKDQLMDYVSGARKDRPAFTLVPIDKRRYSLGTNGGYYIDLIIELIKPYFFGEGEVAEAVRRFYICIYDGMEEDTTFQLTKNDILTNEELHKFMMLCGISRCEYFREMLHNTVKFMYQGKTDKAFDLLYFIKTIYSESPSDFMDALKIIDGYGDSQVTAIGYMFLRLMTTDCADEAEDKVIGFLCRYAVIMVDLAKAESIATSFGADKAIITMLHKEKSKITKRERDNMCYRHQVPCIIAYMMHSLSARFRTVMCLIANIRYADFPIYIGGNESVKSEQYMSLGLPKRYELAFCVHSALWTPQYADSADYENLPNYLRNAYAQYHDEYIACINFLQNLDDEASAVMIYFMHTAGASVDSYLPDMENMLLNKIKSDLKAAWYSKTLWYNKNPVNDIDTIIDYLKTGVYPDKKLSFNLPYNWDKTVNAVVLNDSLSPIAQRLYTLLTNHMPADELNDYRRTFVLYRYSYNMSVMCGLKNKEIVDRILSYGASIPRTVYSIIQSAKFTDTYQYYNMIGTKWSLTIDELSEIFTGREHIIEETLSELSKMSGISDYVVVCLIKTLYKNGYENDDLLFSFLGSRLKYVRECAISILKENRLAHGRDMLNVLRDKLPDMKGSIKTNSDKLVRLWEIEDLIHDKEKIDIDSLSSIMTTGIKFTSSLFKQCTDDMFVLKFKNGDFVDTKLAKAFVYDYINLDDLDDIPEHLSVVARLFDDKSLKEMAVRLYGLWIESGFNVKQKGILALLSSTAGYIELSDMSKQAIAWEKEGRKKPMEYMINALGLCSSKYAVMALNNIMTKAKKSKTKTMAEEQLNKTAKNLGTDLDSLLDSIISDLGFDTNGEMLLDYGPRKFKATIDQQMGAIVLTDEKGKTLRSLPKPNKNDDADSAEKAKEEYKAIREEYKNIMANHTSKLEKYMASGKSWNVDQWKAMYCQNPILRSFAVSLMWGEYEGSRLIKSFRYMEDGSFNTSDEEEYEPGNNQNTVIMLVHPCDLSAEELDQWKEQFENYEVKQPFEQLEAQIYTPGEKYESATERTDFPGEIYTYSAMNVMKKYGWTVSGDQQYEYSDLSGSVRARLTYSDIFYSEMTTVTSLEFIKDGTTATFGSIPTRFYSSIMSYLKKIFKTDL